LVKMCMIFILIVICFTIGLVAGSDDVTGADDVDCRYISQKNTNDDSTGVDVQGDYAYLADSGGGLHIYDITDVDDPSFMGKYVGRSDRVQVNGSYAYVTGSSKLRIIDVSDKEDPKEIGHNDTSGIGKDVDVKGDYAYVADYHNGLVIFDISVRSDPKKVGEFEIGDYTSGVKVGGNFAYMAAGYNGLIVVNITNKSNPTEEWSRDTQNRAYDVDLKGDHVYVADGSSGLLVIDINTHKQVGKKYTGYTSYGVTVNGNLAHLAEGNHGYTIINITDPTDPQGSRISQQYREIMDL